MEDNMPFLAKYGIKSYLNKNEFNVSYSIYLRRFEGDQIRKFSPSLECVAWLLKSLKVREMQEGDSDSGKEPKEYEKGYIGTKNRENLKRPIDIFEAIEQGDADLVALSLDEDPTRVHERSSKQMMQTPLHRVAIRGDIASAMILLDWGADINEVDAYGCMPLHWAADLPMAQFLVAHGAQIEAQDTFKYQRPIHWAASRGHVRIVQYLLEQGAEVNPGSEFDNTPLHLATIHDQMDTCSILLLHGANPARQNNLCEIPLQMANQYKNTTFNLFLSIEKNLELKERMRHYFRTRQRLEREHYYATYPTHINTNSTAPVSPPRPQLHRSRELQNLSLLISRLNL